MASYSFHPFAFVLLFVLAFAADCSHARQTMTLDSVSHPAGEEGTVPIPECPDKCAIRCSGRSDPDRKDCISACTCCCGKCFCVPSGTSGNKEECPCYKNIGTCP